MARYVAGRILSIVPVWLLISVMAFMMIHMSPASPAALLLGGASVPKADILRLTQQLGLNQPLPVQYVDWLAQLLRGNWGMSYFQNAPVLPLVLQHAAITVTIALPALLLAIAIGTAGGVLAAARPGSMIDVMATFGSTLGLSMPEFWLAMILILLFSLNLRIFPALGFVSPGVSLSGWFMHVVLPVFTIGFIQSAPIARIVRSSLLESLGSNFVRTAYAKGLRESVVILKHALRASFLPALTVIGIVVMLVLSGDFVVEIVFAIPGLGRLMLNATLNHDYPLVQGGVLFLGTVVLLVNLLVDVAYAWVDPRVSYD